MKQLLQILRKDIRHFYPEILLNLALLGAFAWLSNSLFSSSGVISQRELTLALLRMLIPVAWLLLVLRAVGDEALAGDRQFWITRPYRRATLLAEKLAFFLIFIHLPVLLMQAFLIARAGLPVTPALGDLLRLQALLFVALVLPLFAIAAVSRTLSQGILCVVGEAFLIVVTIGCFAEFQSGHMLAPQVQWIVLAVLMCALATVVTSMYARRAVWKSRALLVALPILLAVVAAVAPTGWLVRRAFAKSAVNDELLFDANAKKPQETAGGKLEGERALLQLPVKLQEASESDESGVEGVQFTLKSNRGGSWTSPILASSTFLRGGKTESMMLSLPAEVYLRFQQEPVELSLTAFLKRYTFEPAQTVTVSRINDFRTQSGARCAFSAESDTLSCRNALQQLPTELMQFEVQYETCDTPGQRFVLPRRMDGSTPATLDAGLNPLHVRFLSLRHEIRPLTPPNEKIRVHYLCPGAHVQIAEQRLVAQQQVSMHVPSIRLADYLVKGFGVVSVSQE